MKTQINSGLRMICIFACLLIAVSSAMAQAYEPFNYPVGTGTLNGGTGWAGPWSGGNIVAPGLAYPGLTTSGNAMGGTPGSANTRLLQTPVAGAAGTSVVLRALIKSPVNGTPATQATLGNSPGGMGNNFIIGDLPQSSPNANKWGLQNDCGQFYSNKLVVANQTVYLVARIDFNVSGANDQMRLWVQNTGAAVPDSTLFSSVTPDVNVMCNVNTFGGVFWQTQQGQVVDEIGVDTLTPNAPKGMTWLHTASNAQTGTITVGCTGCDAYHGDTQCTQPLPVLCISKSPTPFPLPTGVINSNQFILWSGGVVATTQPHVGMNNTAATAFCQAQFGPLFRVAEFHDGWGWGFQAYGGTVSAPTVPSTRFWVYINDQPGANCP
ncbi:MAG TPA: hypothetical protein VNG71_05655 [Pyrinomonadaceae bacterium]|nr:hypothetical protein [Pyrinomonadaceae bacterium]